MADSTFVRRHSGWIIAIALGLGASGCTFDLADEGSEYREAVPEASSVAVPGPGDTNGTQRTAAVAPERGLMGTGDPATNYAFWYGFTRNVRDGVNQVTAGVLGSVWYLVNTRPTSVSNGTATWGPYTDALEPVTWRFRVTRVGPKHYEYVLDGRPKTSESDADYRVVLKGDGWGRLSEHHGDGTFMLDLDAAKALDPMEHPNDSGVVTIVHDLPRDITSNAFALPRTITADLRPSATPEWLTITSTANQDGTGRLDIDGYVDTDASHATLIEDVGVVSRWRADGAGRADIVLSGGDVPASYGSITASECWGTDFTRVYYSDSASFAPTEGSATACAYDAAL
jgi:hypothetical protein